MASEHHGIALSLALSVDFTAADVLYWYILHFTVFTAAGAVVALVATLLVFTASIAVLCQWCHWFSVPLTTLYCSGGIGGQTH